MKITYLLTTADAAGGTEGTVFTQAGWMAQHADVRIVSMHRTADSPHFALDDRVALTYAADLPETRTPSTIMPSVWDDQYDAGTDAAVVATIAAIRADVVVTTTPALALLAAQHLPAGTRVVHQEHRASARRGSGLVPLELAADRIALVTTLTDRSCEWLAERLGSSVPVVVVPNGMDVAEFPVAGLKAPVIISAGRLVAVKQFHHLVLAFARAARDLPEWRLRIYGDGPAEQTIRHVASLQGMESRVELPGAVSSMRGELAKASVFALASRSEAQPLVLMEAQAAGLPVVSYDTYTGPREILTATGGGIVVPEKSVPGLTAGLRRLMMDTELRSSLGKRARAGIWQYDLEQVGRRWIEVFRAVIEGAPASGVSNGAMLDAARTDDVQVPVTGLDRATRFSMHREIVERLQRDGVRHTTVTRDDDQAWAIAIGGEDLESTLAVVAASQYRVCLTAYESGAAIVDPWMSDEPAPMLSRDASRVRIVDLVGKLVGEIEVWHTDGQLRVAPGGRSGANWVDEVTWNSWLASGTRTVSGRPLWQEAPFDVDVVYTWVDGDDPEWSMKRRVRLGSYAGDLDGDAVRDARYRNRDEIYHSIRAVHVHMPWVRRLIVVTDSQVPERVVREFPDVEIVDHRDIFPDPGVLPVFNSHAIEASLHRIAGLAEHFVYFNDDMIPVRSLPKEKFFHSNGTAKFFPSPSTMISYGGAEDLPHLQAADNNRALLLDELGVEITSSMLHVPYAHRRSVIEQLEDRYPEQFERTRSAVFRSESDISVLSSLAQYYGYFAGKYVPGQIQSRYVNLKSDRLRHRLEQLVNDRDADVVAFAEPGARERRHRNEMALFESYVERLLSPDR